MELTHKIEWEDGTNIQSVVIDEPVGFDSLQVSMERHDYHGIGAEASLGSLEFYGRAADIISGVYNTDIETKIWYKVSGVSELEWLLDLSTYCLKQGKYTSVSCKVCEEGVKTIFNNRTDIQVDLNEPKTIDGEELEKPEWKLINIPTKHLLYTNTSKRKQNKTYTTSGGSANTYPETGIYIGHNNAPYIFLPIGLDNINNEFGTITEQEMPYSTNNATDVAAQYVSDEEHDKKFGQDTEANIEINLQATIERKSTGWNPLENNYIRWYLQAEDTDGKIIKGEEHKIAKSAVNSIGATWDLSCKLKGTLSADKAIRYYLVFDIDMDDATDQYFYAHITIQKGSYVKMTMYDNIEAEDTYTDMIMIKDALAVVTSAISESKLNIVSDWYDIASNGGGALKALTNGYKIRGLYSEPENERNMPMSFKELLSSLNALDCVGWGFAGNAVRVERWNWFYQDNIAMDIDNVEEVTIEAEPEHMVTELTIGYKKYATNSQYNSIESPHGLRVFANNNKVVNQPITKECEFIADNYAIEETRRCRTQLSEMEESSYDENVFVLELTKKVKATEETFLLQGTSILRTATNIGKADEFINAKLTPRHMAARWRDFLFQSINKDALRFMSGEINYKSSFDVIPESQYVRPSIAGDQDGYTLYSLQSFATSAPQVENEDIQYEAAKLKAEKITFEYPLTWEQYKAIKSNPYGIIRVNGREGWIKSFKYSFSDGMAEFILIAKN